MQSTPLEFLYSDECPKTFRDMKDPSLVKYHNAATGKVGYELYASIGTVKGEFWGNGHFRSTTDSAQGPYVQVANVVMHGMKRSEEACASGVLRNDDGSYDMWVQETCFQEAGDIAHLTSKDGTNFYADDKGVTVDDMHSLGYDKNINLLYDAGVSRYVDHKGEQKIKLTFSACEGTGNGDMYELFVDPQTKEPDLATIKIIMPQEKVHFHNAPGIHGKPGVDGFEWGNEGGQVHPIDYIIGENDPVPEIDVSRTIDFGMAVCFLEKTEELKKKELLEHPECQVDEEEAENKKQNRVWGMSQRVFVFGKYSDEEEYWAFGILVDTPNGENGHPDFLVEGERTNVIYQERRFETNDEGIREPGPWSLRYQEFSTNQLYLCAKEILDLPPEERGLRTHLHHAFCEEKQLATQRRTDYVSKDASPLKLVA